MKEMKNLFLCCVLLCGAAVLMAQVPEWESARRAGGNGEDRGNSIAIDSQGNQYVTGAITYSGNTNIYVGRRGTGGNIIMLQQAGGPSNDEGLGIAVDGAGNVYVTGQFQGYATFGSHSLSSSGGYDIFVAKLSPEGIWVWAINPGGTGNSYGYSIALDGAGNVYATGEFRGTVTFGSSTLTVNSSSTNILIVKLDASGNWL